MKNVTIEVGLKNIKIKYNRQMEFDGLPSKCLSLNWALQRQR